MVFDSLHELAKSAVDRMRRMAKRVSGDLTDFHERQLLHALFTELDSRNNRLWAAFEYQYFNGNGRLSGKADICAWANDCYAWFEVECTGLNPNGWDNPNREIWAEDSKKLFRVRGQRNTQTAWVWLFLFETYRKETGTLGQAQGWTPQRQADQMAQCFGRIDTRTSKLARLLHEAGLFARVNGSVATVSIMPQLPRASYNVWQGRTEYSALLLTMDFTPEV
jgi:hypothetical protein